MAGGHEYKAQHLISGPLWRDGTSGRPDSEQEGDERNMQCGGRLG